MKQRIPRRTLKLTRYLESVLVDPKATSSMKSVASGRLTDLFLADAAAKARREIAIARAEARVEAARLEKTGEGIIQTHGQLLGQPDAIGVPQAGQDVKSAVQDYLAKYVGK